MPSCAADNALNRSGFALNLTTAITRLAARDENAASGRSNVGDRIKSSEGSGGGWMKD
jgi:hypothetical protein